MGGHRRAEVFATLPHTDRSAFHVNGVDFSTFLYSSLDSVHNIEQYEQDQAQLVAWCAEVQAQEVWRWHHPTSNYYKSPSRRRRTDHICPSMDLVQENSAIQITT